MTSEVYQTIRDRRKKKKERKTYRKAVCQMTENEQNIGHGCLVYDSLINNPEQSKYCIITSTKVISDSNLAGKDYHVLFERVSSSGDPRDIELSDIIVKETPTTHDFISHDSGLVLIFIDPRSHQLSHGHGIFRRECSVLKHVPTVASPSEERETFCYVDGERYKCVETNGVYSLVPNNTRANSHGCFLFERVPGRNKLNVVGIINGNNEQQVISPVWLPSSLQEIILEEERKKEEEDRKKKEEEDRKKKEEEDRKKKEEEDRKKKEEEDRKKKEEEHRKKKEEKDGKKKEEEDRKKREEEERKKEEEDMKKQEEDRKKKEEEERRKKEEDIKKQEEDRKKNEKEDRKKGEEEERKKEEEDIKKEEQDRKKEEEDRKKEEEDGNRKEKTDGPPGEALVTTSEVDSVVYAEQSNTEEPLQRPPINSMASPSANGTQNRSGETSTVSDQSRNGQHVGDRGSEGHDVTTEFSAQTLNYEEDVENIRRRMQDAGLSERNFTSETKEKMTDDVVDAGMKQIGSQVNTRLSTSVKRIPLRVYRRVCLMLNVKRDVRFDDFRMLAEKVGLDRDETNFVEQLKNPTGEILKTWSKKSEATVGKLIEILKGEDLERMDVVKILQDWVNEKITK